jgi:hypothetical protein
MNQGQCQLEPYVSVLELKEPISHKNLTLIPIAGPQDTQLKYILTAQALKMGTLTITEINESGSVPELLVTNTCDMMVLMLDGEELLGAKQNRILNTTILVPAQSKMKIPVSCVERGRWNFTATHFSSGSYAPSILRAKRCASVTHSLQHTGQPTSNQGEVWNTIENMLNVSHSVSGTRAMHDMVQQQEPVINQYVEAFPYPEGCRGVVATINGKFMGLDLFDKPITLESIWNKLVRASVMDAILQQDQISSEFTSKGAQTLLEHLGELPCQAFPSKGTGEDWRFQAEDILGQALVAENVCVHLCAFPNKGKEARPKDKPTEDNPAEDRPVVSGWRSWFRR